jgi:hypothetical protein
MYSFLFNQTYITIFVVALLIFLIMFLWRKLTILEGNYYLLEKRVNIIKKDERAEQLSKNLERSDAIMKEVFKNNIKRDSCNINDGICPMPKDSSEEDYIMDDLEGNIDITIINVEESNEETKQDVEIEIVNNDEDELVSHIETITNDSDKKEDILEYINNATNNSDTSDETETADTADATETASITSEIIFNNEDDKALSRKYKAMNLEKLREECKNNSLNTEGTKSILISRIIENIKKQK